MDVIKPVRYAGVTQAVFLTAFAAFLALPYATFFSPALSATGRFSSDAVNQLWYACMCGYMVMFVLQIAFGRRTSDTQPLGKLAGIIASSAVMLASLVLMVVTAWVDAIPYAASFVATIFNGLASGYLYATWMLALANVERQTGRSDVVASVAFLAAMAASLLLRIVSQPLAVLTLFCLAAYGSIALCMVAMRATPTSDSEAVWTSGSQLVGNAGIMGIAAVLVVIWTAFSCVEMPSMAASTPEVSEEMPLLALAGALVVASAIAFVLLHFSPTINFQLMARVAACLVGAGLVLCLLLPDSMRLVGYPAAFCGMTLMNVTVWIVGARMVLASSTPRERAVAAVLPRLAIFLTLFFANLTFPLVSHTTQPLQVIMLFVLLVMVTLVGPVALDGRSSQDPAHRGEGAALGSGLGTRPLAHDEGEMASSQQTHDEWQEGASWDTILETIAKDHGLTPRETEVFCLLARGRNAEYIRNRLGISRNTVNTHIAHVYRKAGVGSHQELLDMIEHARA